MEHGLLLENLLDLAHAPFTHTSTFAKGWPVPDVVRFNAARMLGGNWEPYPIDMAFEPPCMVLSTIGALPPAREPGARRRCVGVCRDVLECGVAAHVSPANRTICVRPRCVPSSHCRSGHCEDESTSHSRRHGMQKQWHAVTPWQALTVSLNC